MKRATRMKVGGWIAGLGLGLIPGAPMAFSGEPPLPPPAHKASAAPLPAGALSDADIERIALKILEIQERRRAQGTGKSEGDPDAAGAVQPPTGDKPAQGPKGATVVTTKDEPASPPAYVTSPRVIAPPMATLPPPAGIKQTRFGLPLVGGVDAPTSPVFGPATRGGTGPNASPSSDVDADAFEERYFLLGRAAGGSAPATSTQGGASSVPDVAARRAARLLGSEGHSPSALQDDVLYGDRDRSLILGGSGGTWVTGGSVPVREVRTSGGRSYVVEGGGDEKKYQQVVPGWVAMVAAQGKFSIAGSSASNETFKELGIGRANTLQKGFNADSVDVSNKLGFGSLWGHVRAAYYASPSGADSEVELLHAYGEAPFKEVPSDAKERLILRLGKSPVPLGFYNGSAWETWAWQARPLVYGRLFNGNLLGMGIDALIRPEVRDVTKDAVIRIGMFNGNSDSLPGFLTSSEKNRVGYYPTDDKQRYSLTDFLYYADAAAVADLTPSAPSAFFAHGGAFALYGPNGTGENGETLVYGLRGRLLWLRCRTVTPGVADGFLLETEWVKRDYHVDEQGANPSRDLEDWGGYLSAVYTLDHAVPGRLSFGAKYDFARSSGENYVAAGTKTRAEDPLRANRTRWTGLLSWEPEPTMPVFGKFAFSLEYVYDEAEFLGEDKHSVIVGLQVR